MSRPSDVSPHLQLPQGRRYRFSTVNMGWMGSTTTEYWSTILRRMPFLTQTRLKISLNEDPVLDGSLAFGTSTNSQGSEIKRMLIRQYNDRLYTPLSSDVRRPEAILQLRHLEPFTIMADAALC